MPNLLLRLSSPPAAGVCLGLLGGVRSELRALFLLYAHSNFQNSGCLICHIPLLASITQYIQDPDELSPLAKRQLRKVNSIPIFS